MGGARKPLVWLQGEIKTPPFSVGARIEAGTLLRLIQEGQSLGMPHSRPLSGIAPRCHELRVQDEQRSWRIIYRVDRDAIVIADVFHKATNKTPKNAIDNSRRRLRLYDEAVARVKKESRE